MFVTGVITMIEKFGRETALLVIDAQKGVNQHDHWGGCEGHRNNPEAEERIAALLETWRRFRRLVYFTLHDSREAASPLKLALESGESISGLEPLPDERVIVKDVNSGFVGTNLELQLRRDGVDRLLVCGFFTNMCVETTVRMAGNMGFDCYLAHDACAAGNRIGPNGETFSADQIHAMSIANMHGEFCTAITAADAIALAASSNHWLERVQGNEPERGSSRRVA